MDVKSIPQDKLSANIHLIKRIDFQRHEDGSHVYFMSKDNSDGFSFNPDMTATDVVYEIALEIEDALKRDNCRHIKLTGDEEMCREMSKIINGNMHIKSDWSWQRDLLPLYEKLDLFKHKMQLNDIDVLIAYRFGVEAAVKSRALADEVVGYELWKSDNTLNSRNVVKLPAKHIDSGEDVEICFDVSQNVANGLKYGLQPDESITLYFNNVRGLQPGPVSCQLSKSQLNKLHSDDFIISVDGRDPVQGINKFTPWGWSGHPNIYVPKVATDMFHGAFCHECAAQAVYSDRVEFVVYAHEAQDESYCDCGYRFGEDDDDGEPA